MIFLYWEEIKSMSKRGIFRQVVIIGIIACFVGVSIGPTVLGYNPRKTMRTIYVDDGNTSGPWDGTIENPFQHIQDGIDVANAQDTVYVYSGTYYENIVIEHSIKNLFGENKYYTIIDGNSQGSVILIHKDAHGINFNGFTVQNSGREQYDCGIWVELSDFNVFENIIIKNNQLGIIFRNHEATVKDCIIENNACGIYSIKNTNITEPHNYTGNYIKKNDSVL